MVCQTLYFQLWQLTAFADWASSNFHKSIFTVHATYGWALLWTTFWKVIITKSLHSQFWAENVILHSMFIVSKNVYVIISLIPHVICVLIYMKTIWNWLHTASYWHAELNMHILILCLNTKQQVHKSAIAENCTNTNTSVMKSYQTILPLVTTYCICRLGIQELPHCHMDSTSGRQVGNLLDKSLNG